MKQVAYNARLKATMDRRAKLFSEAAIYYRFKRLPAVKLERYAEACLETVLRHSEDARNIYLQIIKCWGLPGCQLVIDEFAKRTPDTRAWLLSVATVKNQTMPDFPSVLVDACLKYQSDADFEKVSLYTGHLILIGFNRKIDLDNHTPKVLPSQAPYLARAIFFYSLFEYLQTNPQKSNPNHVMLGKMLYEFYQVVTDNHTTRKERQLKQNVISTLRHEGFTLCHDETMLTVAELWYKARVLSNTLREAADKEFLDPIDLSKRIAVCDNATGYPRHK